MLWLREFVVGEGSGDIDWVVFEWIYLQSDNFGWGLVGVFEYEVIDYLVVVIRQ